ncbi:hypothetical protein PsalSR1_03951 [Piscirickettsia salmonis]|nr:hypothetical protein PsalSR1_03951 [Piscirickettsia salmonis]
MKFLNLKSVKQNSSFEKSPTRIVTSQLNHIYYSILGFCRLERLKINLRKTQFTYPRSKLRGISENYPFGP